MSDCKSVPVEPAVQELRTLTNNQATIMRQLRIHTVRLDVAMENISSGVCKLCDHDPMDDNCPSCEMWDKVCEMRYRVTEFCKEYDRLLKAGPAPRGTK